MNQLDSLVQQAAQLIKDGQKDAARQRLAEALSLDSQRVDAWLLLANVTYSAAEEIDCLKRVLALDPNQTGARQRLAELKAPSTTAARDSSPSTKTEALQTPTGAPVVAGVAAQTPKVATYQKPAKKRSRRAISPWWLMIGLAGLACGAIWLLVLIRPLREIVFGAATPTLAAQAGSGAACQRFIDQALQLSNKSCSQIGPNKVCYGNNALQATLADGSGGKFAQSGDVVDAFALRKLSASPLSLGSNEWGIAVFKLLANLPRTAPGQNVTFIVFGNTSLSSAERGLESFYFSSGAGRLTCDQVPMDGITVSMPKGGGGRFVVNGAQLTLLGNAALEAHPNQSMTVSILSGSALVSADGVDRYFGAGQQVGVPLGGANGVEASGPPSEPSPLAPAAQQAACTLTGAACNPSAIQTLSPADAQAAVQQAVGPIPTTGLPSALTPATTNPATATGPRRATPTLAGTRLQTRTPTPSQSPVNARTATGTPTTRPTLTASPTVTATSNGAPSQTSTATRTATGSSTSGARPTPTSTPSLTLAATQTPPVSTPTFTQTPTSLPATSTYTATSAPTDTPTPTPTSTATDTPAPPTATPTFTAAPCNLSGSGLNAGGTDLSLSIQNNSSTTITIASASVAWVQTPASQKLRTMLVTGNQVWAGPDNNSPSSVPGARAWSGSVTDRQIPAGASRSITFAFQDTLQASGYSVTIVFDNGCTVSTGN